MIFDCFIFNNEMDILDIRLNELNDVVDKFVLVESTTSHTNVKKPLHFLQNKKRFSKFSKKIIHIIVDDSPQVTFPWIINQYQFDQMLVGLKNCKPNDVILMSDIDEIPKATKITEFNDGKDNLKVFEQILFNFYLNNADFANPPWQGTHMTTFKNLKKIGSPWIAKFSKPDVIIEDGGWHFSYIGDVRKIREKIAFTTHQEFNNDKYNTPEKISKALLNGEDLFKLGRKFKIVDVNLLPEYVINNQSKFKSYILENRNQTISNNKIMFLYLDIKDFFRVKFIRKIKNKL